MRILCCPAVSLCPIRARGRRACPVEPRIGPSGPRRNDLDEAEHWHILGTGEARACQAASDS